MHNCETGCGRPVSDNKVYCLACDSSRNRGEGGTTDSCVLIRIRSKHVDSLFRDSDGCMIAQRQGPTVLVGSDIKTQAQHVFMDEEAAIRFIRAMGAIREERDGESLISQPSSLALRN